MMNRRLLTATLMLVAALPVLAQGPRGRGNSLDFLAGYLSLTDSQKTQATAIFAAADTASTTARGTLTAAQDALRAAVKLNRPDAELDRLAAAVGVVEGNLAGIRAKADAKFYILLTAEQKTKYDALLASRGGGPGRP
ncbi:MAG: Spy/CpxP family protein refolding chaperone [Bryobacteraceae bacterium]|nr:Spy/CpxP family protein refolding chaperone [Bryobacteraceae bacterium]